MLAPIKSEEQDRFDFVMGRIEDSQDRYSGQNAVFRELNRYYLSQPPTVSGRENDRPLRADREVRKDIFVGESFAIVESAVPNWIFGMFGNRPYVRVLGRTQDDHDKKDAVEMMLDYDFAQGQVFMESIPVGKSVYKYGTGVAQVTWELDAYYLEEEVEEPFPNGIGALGQLLTGWRRKKKRRLVTEFDGPKLEWISVYNFGVDPLYWRLRDMRYCWKDRWTDRATLRYEDARYRELTGKALYKNLDKIPLTKVAEVEDMYQVDASDDTSEVMGWSGSSWRRPPVAQIREIGREDDRVVRVTEYWGRDEWVQVANGERIIHDGPNPYSDKRLPFVMPKCYELEGYPWGFGLLHATKSEQEELNSWRQLIMKQAALNVKQVWAVETGVDLGPAHQSELNAGDIIEVPFSSAGKPLTQTIYDTKPLPPEAYGMEDRMRSDIQRKLAFSESMMFGQEGGKGETATKSRMAGQGTANRFRLQNAIGDFTYLREVAKFFYARRQQFFKKEEIFRIIGKEGVKFERLTPEEIAGNFDYEPMGQTMAPNPDVRRQQLIETLAMVGSNAVYMEKVNVDELFMELWKLSDHQWPERFVNQPPENQWRPETENIVLLEGEFVPVSPMHPHAQHVPVHQQAIQKAAGDPDVMTRVMDHIQKHQHFMDAMQGAPPQEQPGRQAQYQGEMPPSSPAGVTQGSLEAIAGGGTSG